MTIKERARYISQYIIDWCFDRKVSSDDDYPSHLIEEALKRQRSIDLYNTEKFILDNVDPKLVIYHNDTWYSLDEFIQRLRKEVGDAE